MHSTPARNRIGARFRNDTRRPMASIRDGPTRVASARNQEAGDPVPRPELRKVLKGLSPLCVKPLSPLSSHAPSTGDRMIDRSHRLAMGQMDTLRAIADKRSKALRPRAHGSGDILTLLQVAAASQMRSDADALDKASHFSPCRRSGAAPTKHGLVPAGIQRHPGGRQHGRSLSLHAQRCNSAPTGKLQPPESANWQRVYK